jgi:glucose-1-phosphate adenylyltransferase
MKHTLTVILGGGAGTRLYPLTKYRAKPAVPLTGKYRLIDVAISNSINSELRHIYVLTQYLSSSLNRHVSQAYRFDIFSNGFVEILAAEQAEEGGHWYQGTADALRQQWHTFDIPGFDLFLVLPGDALYHMDYRPLIRQHRESGADITVAVNTVPRKNAHHFGLLHLDEKGIITEFREKPKGDAMDGMEAPKAMLEKFGDRFSFGDTFLASMGVYVFNRSVLERYVLETDFNDFGKHIIPAAIKSAKCHGYIFPGYWEDIGTIAAFFEAHMGLLKDPPVFSFNRPSWPIFTRPRFLPNINAVHCNLENCRVADGCILEGATVRTSIIGIRSHVRRDAVIEDSILMGCDYYEENARHRADVPLGIGERAVIKRAIIDKNVRIGRGVKILNIDNVREKDSDLYYIRDGIVIIPKNTVIPDGTVI